MSYGWNANPWDRGPRSVYDPGTLMVASMGATAIGGVASAAGTLPAASHFTVTRNPGRLGSAPTTSATNAICFEWRYQQSTDFKPPYCAYETKSDWRRPIVL